MKKRVRKTKKQLEAEAYRRMVRETIKAQAEFRADETAKHMDEIAGFIEEQGSQVSEGLGQARRGHRRASPAFS